jgi:hypothetical protein
MLLAVFIIELLVETPWALFPPVKCGGPTTTMVDVVSQDDAPLDIITTARTRAEVFVGCLTSLTQLGTNLVQALMWSN